MRFTRLKDKLESGADLAATHAPNTAPVQKAPRLIPALASVPQKRKAPCISKNGRGGQTVTKQIGSRPLGGSSKVEKRHTRGKKLNYNLSDLDSNDEDDSDDSELTELTSIDSDGDFQVDEAGRRSQVDSGLNFDSEEVTKPALKRAKKQAPVEVIRTNGMQTSNNRKNKSTMAKRIPPSKLQLSVKQAPITRRTPTSEKKAPVKSLLPSFDQPITSIEASPPLSIASSYDQTESEGDLDITRLQPGTILSFGSTGGAGAFNSPPNKGKHTQVMTTSRAPGIAKTTSQTPSSKDSAGVTLQMELKNHVLEVTPDDSVSMVNKKYREERLNLGPSPKTPSPTTGE